MLMKAAGPKDGTVNMRFRSKMHDGIDLVARRRSSRFLVANIPLDELVSGFHGQILQVFQAAGIGQQVQVENKDIGKLVRI